MVEALKKRRRGREGERREEEESVILQLIRTLLGGASEVESTPPVAMEIGRCLGEFGGLDLNCIALPPSLAEGE